MKDFIEIYDQYLDKIYNFVYYKTFHKETAEDLTSDIFLKALKKLETFDSSKGSLSAWLYQIARNTVIDFYRKKKPDLNIEEIWDLSDETDIESDFDAAQKIKDARKYLDRLDKTQKEIVILRIWEELPYKEIAEITGKSEAACKMAFIRAIESLKKEAVTLDKVKTY